MKKVLLFAPMGSVHRRFNGANISALRELGFDVHLLANFSAGPGPEKANEKYAQECEDAGIKVHSLPFERGSLFKNIKLLSSLKNLLVSQRFEIVHAHTETGGILLRLCKGVQGSSTFIFTPHGMSFYKGSSLKSQLIYKPIERWICKGMDVNLAMNMEEMENLKNWHPRSARFVHGIGLDTAKMHISYGKVHDEIRKEFGIPADGLMLLSIGELNENKNHSAVINALAELKNDKIFYVICGVGELDQELISLASDLGLKERVILAGFRSDIPDIVTSADIFVFPSFHEGLPVSVLEAMAGGLPTIVSAIRGNVDLIEDGYNGFLFEPTNPKQIAEKLNLLVASQDLRTQMGQINHKKAEDFSYSVVKEELSKIYSNCTC